MDKIVLSEVLWTSFFCKIKWVPHFKCQMFKLSCNKMYDFLIIRNEIHCVVQGFLTWNTRNLNGTLNLIYKYGYLHGNEQQGVLQILIFLQEVHSLKKVENSWCSVRDITSTTIRVVWEHQDLLFKLSELLSTSRDYLVSPRRAALTVLRLF